MKNERRYLKLFAAFTLLCGLSWSARAQLGTGWTPDNEIYIPQTSTGCAITAIAGGYSFSLPSGHGRAEQRGNNLPDTTTNQWQGLCTINSLPSSSNKIACHQVFGPPPSTPDLILDIMWKPSYVKEGPVGGLMLNNFLQGEAYLASLQVGVQFQLNTIYIPGSEIYIYVNGSLVGSETPNAGVHYNKFGAYAQESGSGPATYQWVDVQSWSGGNPPNGNGNPTVATPAFSPAGGTYTSPQSVSISDSTSGATLYYTTNGTTPTTSSTVYSGPISVSSTVTIEAMGAASGDTNSNVASATYTISAPPPTQVATPAFSPAVGTYTSAVTVTISDSTSGATLYYTTNGTTPTTSSTVYSGPISVSSTTTIEAIGAKSGDTNSNVASATYTISSVPPPTQVATPTINPNGGSFTGAVTVTIADSTGGSAIRYTTDGSAPSESNGAIYSGSISIGSSTTLRAIAYKSGDTDSNIASANFTINTTGGSEPAPTFSEPTGTYSGEVHVRIKDTDSNASLYYTTNGSTPTSSSTPVPNSTIEFKSTTTVKAIAIDNGVTSAVTSATYTID
ncbi:MAG: chitobiase/beta-hexosaminidase C-terminal domain-containing protein [Opitutaceae bacterium]|jgi:hypothetical protein